MDNLFETRPVNLMEFGSENGIYLETAEVQNWGPFSGRWVIPLRSLPALFIGENGTGKSSLMDGILTLLVANGLHYNNASDSKGKRSEERKLIEYVRGFKESSRDDDYYKNTLYLRDKGEITAILLRFSCGIRYCTIANVFMAKEGDAVSTFYVCKEGSLSLYDFPKNASSFEEYRTSVSRLSGVTVTSDKHKYFLFVRDKLSLDDNGMKLIASLSTKKDLQDAEDVIRSYMFLEDSDFRADYEKTKEAVEKIKVVVKELKDMQLRSHILESLVPYIKDGRSLQKELQLWKGCKDKISSYVFRCASGAAVKELDKLKAKETRLRNKRDEIDDKIRDKIELRATLKVQRDNQGGLEVAQKEMVVRGLERQKLQAESLFYKFTDALKRVDIFTECLDDVSLDKIRQEIRNEKNKLRELLDLANQRLNEFTSESVSLGKELQVLKSDLARLERNKVVVDEGLVSVRDELCRSLGIEPDVMPFLGEYLSVNDEEWVPALEHLLHYESTSFLVPEKYAVQTAAFFKNHERSRQTIRYRKMSPVDYMASDGAWKKIDIREDMPYAAWVRDYLKKVARHVCCDTPEEFNRNFPAVMKNGLIRQDKQRHSIDEKINIFNPRYFVMSGSYIQRCDALHKDIAALETKRNAVFKKVAEAKNMVDDLNLKSDGFSSIPFVESFSDIDVALLERKLFENREALEILKNSKDLKKIDESIRQIDTVLADFESDKKKVVEEFEDALRVASSFEDKIRSFQEGLDNVLFSDEEEALLKALFDKRCPTSANPKFETIMGSSSWMTRDSNDKINQLEIATGKACDEAVSLMNRYLSECVSRRNELVPSMTKEGEAEKFILEYERVRDEWLPEAIKKSEDASLLGQTSLLNTFIIKLTHNVDDTVKDIVKKINDTLHKVPYSQDANPTFLDVGCKRTKDSRVVMLREKLDHVAQYIGDHDSRPEMLVQCADLMEYIGSNLENVKKGFQKDNILDVRNWFQYPVAECRMSENGKDFYHVKELDEVAKQSGGEGVKLTYFVMAACYSMWMHLLDDNYGGNTFRFLMIDEIDTKISPSNLKDVIMLFNLLGIQMVSLLPVGDKVSQYEGFVGNIACTGYLNKPESYVDTISYAEYINRNKECISERLKQGKDSYHG